MVSKCKVSVYGFKENGPSDYSCSHKTHTHTHTYTNPLHVHCDVLFHFPFVMCVICLLLCFPDWLLLSDHLLIFSSLFYSVLLVCLLISFEKFHVQRFFTTHSIDLLE
jgi:hypothetical protein